MTDNPCLATALDLHDGGYAVLPIRAGLSKAPALPSWRDLMAAPPTRKQVIDWFTNTPYGLGLIQGAVSGNAELAEIEGRAAHRMVELRDLAESSGLGDLWAKVTNGWLESSPSGGFHIHYRCQEPVPGNKVLARRPATPQELAENPDRPVRVLAETRGQGGYVVIAPTPGTHHETGRPWARLVGGPATAPMLSADERQALLDLLRTLDQMPEPTQKPSPTPNTPPHPADGGTTPGDDFEARTDWADILVPHGWTLVTARGHTRYWRRPGKTIGISATTGQADDRDRLYVFTTSTDFQAEVPYTKFGAYTLLKHGGDHSAAAKALAHDGYGTPAPAKTLRLVPSNADSLEGLIAPPSAPPATQPVRAIDGATALQPAPMATITEHVMTLTDVGNAQLLVARHAHHIRYVARRGEWLTWDGHHWQADTLGLVTEHAKQTILDIKADDGEAAKHRTRSLSRRAVEAMIALARSDPAVAITPDQLDAHPTLLCTPGGVVDLATGRIEPARPEQLHTRTTPVAPEPVPTPRWDRFLNQTFDGHTELVGYVQRLAGYSATGQVTRHILPFLLGPGGNGKSVFLDVIRHLLGDYAATTPAKFLMAGITQHETEIARLSGLRLVIASEVNEDDRFDEAKMKLLTGGDALTARFMHQNHFTFTPTHTLWLMGNHQPRVSVGGDSFWRRLRLIPFTNTIPENDRIDGLDKILITEEGPGILQWIIDGAKQFLTGGMATPDIVRAATDTYASEEDQFARFAEDILIIASDTTNPAIRTDTSQVREAYESWCRIQGEKPVSPQVFGRELRTRYGVNTVRSHGRRYYGGITLVGDCQEGTQSSFEDWLKK